MATKTKKPVYWTGDVGTHDDFGAPYTNVMFDGKTKFGPWANMASSSWLAHGIRLGTGYGQKYVKQADGRWLKVEG